MPAISSSISLSPPAAVHTREPGRRPGAKRHARSQARVSGSPTLHSLTITLVIALLALCQGVGASDIYTAVPLEQWSQLIFDTSDPPAPPMRLQARQEAATTTSLTQATYSTNASASSTATPTSESPLPSPFDSFMTNNFTTASCPAFFESFLGNDTFQKCTPLSLLLQTSNGFFEAERSLVRLTQTLDAACSVDFDVCSSVMASLAQEVQLTANCGADLALQNPVVNQALNGFLGYDPLYHAGCLTDNSGSYCFADAVTNASAPSNSYIYYLPLGVPLPAGTRPSCNACLKDTMIVFAAAASNNSVPISGDYASAAQQLDANCGSTFVQASIEATNAACSIVARPFGLGVVTSIVLLFSLLT